MNRYGLIHNIKAINPLRLCSLNCHLETFLCRITMLVLVWDSRTVWPIWFFWYIASKILAMFRVHLFTIYKIYKIIPICEFSVKLFIKLISNIAWLQLIVGDSQKEKEGLEVWHVSTLFSCLIEQQANSFPAALQILHCSQNWSNIIVSMAERSWLDDLNGTFRGRRTHTLPHQLLNGRLPLGYV